MRSGLHYSRKLVNTSNQEHRRRYKCLIRFPTKTGWNRGVFWLRPLENKKLSLRPTKGCDRFRVSRWDLPHYKEDTHRKAPRRVGAYHVSFFRRLHIEAIHLLVKRWKQQKASDMTHHIERQRSKDSRQHDKVMFLPDTGKLKPKGTRSEALCEWTVAIPMPSLSELPHPAQRRPSPGCRRTYPWNTKRRSI